MSHADGWALVALDILHFFQYFGFIGVCTLGNSIRESGKDDDKAFGSFVQFVGIVWGLWVVGIAAGYWS